jgi:hypothetical protein
MSTNYSADLATRVEPCIFGGNPDCSQCGCAISSGLHWFKDFRLAGFLKIEHIARTSVAVGSAIGRPKRLQHPLPLESGPWSRASSDRPIRTSTDQSGISGDSARPWQTGLMFLIRAQSTESRRNALCQKLQPVEVPA